MVVLIHIKWNFFSNVPNLSNLKKIEKLDRYMQNFCLISDFFSPSPSNILYFIKNDLQISNPFQQENERLFK